MATTNPFKVRLDSYAQGRSTTPRQSVIFAVMPTISQSHSVDYQPFDPVHTPGTFYVYRGSKAVQFEISAKLVSRTTTEATQNLAYLNILRGWTRGYFGFGTANDANQGTKDPLSAQQYQNPSISSNQQQSVSPLTAGDLQNMLSPTSVSAPTGSASPTLTGTSSAAQQAFAQQTLASLNNTQVNSTLNVAKTNTTTTQQTLYSEGKELLGAPPEVVYLTAYSDASNANGLLNKQTNITRVPTVILSLGYTYPNDVDYIPTLEGQPFPIVMDITISLAETHSPKEFEQFDLYKYRNGNLPGF